MAISVVYKKIDAVVLLSGGIDSAVAAAIAQTKGRRLHGLAVDYGQRHRRELTASKKLAAALGLKSYRSLKLPLGQVASGSLVDGKLIRQSGVTSGKPATYVSFRNGVLLSLAAATADALGASEIWGGWCLADRGGYPDCRPAFLKAMQSAVRLGTARSTFKIVAPLVAKTKAKTICLAKKLGIDFSMTWTCYVGGRKPCYRCDACRLRALGFAGANMKDPL